MTNWTTADIPDQTGRTAVITGANTGLAAGYLWRVLDAYRIAMPTAFCCVLVVRPLVVQLVAWTVHPPR